MAIGIRDGRYDGEMLTATRENSLRQAGIDFAVPPVRTLVSRLPLDDERTILRIDIPPSEHAHETVNGEVYLRVGDESKKLSYSRRRELDYDRGNAQFEYEPAVGATIDDLDADELSVYREAIGATAADRIALQARSLLRRNGALTQASVLLLGSRPQGWFPQVHIRVTRFSDDIAGTGRRQTAVHRSCSTAGDHIRVDIFPSRIEIESPGRLPGLADPTIPLDIPRYARNPRIARVCSDLGITQERGEGIRRMFEEMRLVGLADPGASHLTPAAATSPG